MGAKVVIPPGRLHQILTDPGGSASAVLRRRAERIAAQARVNSASNGSIAQGIVVGPVVDGLVRITSYNPHTLLVHQGSRPHEIRPRRRGGVLRFRVGNRIVYARRVNHPGYPGNPFLTDALRQAG